MIVAIVLIGFWVGAALYFKNKSDDLSIALKFSDERLKLFYEEIRKLQEEIRRLKREQNKDTKSKPHTANPDSSYFHNIQSITELKKQYRNLAKKHHPDIANDNGEKMQQINDEYNKIYKKFKEANNDRR